MEFDYFPDYTEPLEDRACCHPLELYDYIFATGTTPFHVSDEFKSAALKRVMIIALLVPDLELGLIRWIEAFGFDWSEMAIGVNPKEREMKLEPRLFAKLVFSARM